MTDAASGAAAPPSARRPSAARPAPPRSACRRTRPARRRRASRRSGPAALLAMLVVGGGDLRARRLAAFALARIDDHRRDVGRRGRDPRRPRRSPEGANLFTLATAAARGARSRRCRPCRAGVDRRAARRRCAVDVDGARARSSSGGRRHGASSSTPTGRCSPSSATTRPTPRRGLPVVDDSRRRRLGARASARRSTRSTSTPRRRLGVADAGRRRQRGAARWRPRRRRGRLRRSTPARRLDRVFGFYTPSLRTTELIPGQVRLLRSLLAGREDDRPARDPRRRPHGTYMPEPTPEPTRDARP